jgi:hypothetical protein
VIRPGYTDQHRVKGKKEIQFYFSTADSIDSGSIGGRVLFKMTPDSTGLVKLVALSAIDSTGAVTRAKESRVAFCGPDGSFEFEALPTDGTPFRIWAFTDKNSDTRFSGGDEFSSVLADTFRLTSSAPGISGIEINIIDPDEPGRIEGSIIDLAETGIYPTARFDPVFEEGTTVMAYCDSTGVFTVPVIPPGGYVFTAFIDMLPDSLPGEAPDPSDSTGTVTEPFTVYPDTVDVAPGAELKLDPVYIQKETDE